MDEIGYPDSLHRSNPGFPPAPECVRSIAFFFDVESAGFNIAVVRGSRGSARELQEGSM